MDKFSGDEVSVRRSVAFIVRSSRTGTAGFVAEISRAVWAVNPNLPVAGVRTLQEVYNRSLARTSFTLVLLALAGGMALLLGIAGIYGVMSYSVSQRTREIGIRVALGARNGEVIRMFVSHGARLAAVGIGCGLVVAMLLTQFMSSLLFNVQPRDPLTYAVVCGSLVLAAIAASYVPALRATSVDPVHALRAE
jgi:ABC-type antimicrobial peptide transport system permease subunit